MTLWHNDTMTLWHYTILDDSLRMSLTPTDLVSPTEQQVWCLIEVQHWYWYWHHVYLLAAGPSDVDVEAVPVEAVPGGSHRPGLGSSGPAGLQVWLEMTEGEYLIFNIWSLQTNPTNPPDPAWLPGPPDAAPPVVAALQSPANIQGSPAAPAAAPPPASVPGLPPASLTSSIQASSNYYQPASDQVSRSVSRTWRSMFAWIVSPHQPYHLLLLLLPVAC